MWVASSIDPPLQRVMMKQSGALFQPPLQQPVGGSLSSCAAPSSEPSSFSRWSSPSRRCLSLPFQPHRRDGFTAPSAIAVVAISPTTFVPREPSPTLSKTCAVCVLIVRNEPKSLSRMTNFDTLSLNVHETPKRELPPPERKGDKKSALRQHRPVQCPLRACERPMRGARFRRALPTVIESFPRAAAWKTGALLEGVIEL